MRLFSGYVSILKEKTVMRLLEEITQKVQKEGLRIQECQVHADKRNLFE